MSSLSLTAEEFSKLGERVLKQCSNYIDKLECDSIVPSLKSIEAVKSYEYEDLPENGEGAAAIDRLDSLFRQCCLVNGRFLGFVTGSALPVAALADLAISVTNQNTIAPFVAPSAVAIERTVVKWMAQAIGCDNFSGSLTSGGSLSNLMGLAMARESKMPVNYTGIGPDSRQVVFYASKEIHMSTPKAMSLLGLGRKSLRLLEVDNRYRLRAETVAKAIAEDRKTGLLPVAIVVSAGTTRTGAVDCLDELADLAEAEGLWLHVDGAYGAFAAMALPDTFKSLKRANSITLDPHKWLFMPLDCGCLLFRDKRDAIKAFSYFDDYAHSPSKTTSAKQNLTGHSDAFYEETIELSRRFRALKIWLAMRYHGAAPFRKAIADNLQQAQLLATIVSGHPDLELLAPVDLSVVCFRVIKIDGADIPHHAINEINGDILTRMIARGRVYLSKVLINNEVALRACITNHLTTAEDIVTVVEEVLAASLDHTILPHRRHASH